MMTVLYNVGDKLYLNITNKCHCSCVFCIRNNGEGAYGSDSLWLEREPKIDEIKAMIDKTDINLYKEIVFCGFGEPLERLETVIETAEYIKTISDIPIRLNTNGLSDLIHKKPTAHLLEGKIDIVSISMNASNEDEYMRVTQPCFGKEAFSSMLNFAKDCKKYIPNVIFSVVDIISEEEIENCKNLANSMNIKLRVRKYDN